MKKTIAALLALFSGIVVANLFAPLPRSSSSPPVPASSYKTPHPGPQQQLTQTKERHRPKPYPPVPDQLKASTWWKCDPLDPNTIFQGMKENVQTFGTQKPEDMGYKNCVNNPDIGDEEGAHPLWTQNKPTSEAYENGR
jgi:hypothetical protein